MYYHELFIFSNVIHCLWGLELSCCDPQKIACVYTNFSYLVSISNIQDVFGTIPSIYHHMSVLEMFIDYPNVEEILYLNVEQINSTSFTCIDSI